MPKQHVNKVILDAIPIDKDLKRYFLRKFKTMVENNGQAYACDKMKHLRETLMGYRADANRVAHAEAWLTRSGLKVNGWVRKLFSYMDTQPEYALQFVKLYCGPNEPIVSVGQSAEAQHRVLAEARSVNSKTPAFLLAWLYHVVRQRKLTLAQFQFYKKNPGSCPWFIYRVVWGHSYEEYVEYISKWKRILFVSPLKEEDLRRRIASYSPRAEMYVDFGKGHAECLKTADSFDDDVQQWIAMQWYLDTQYEFGGNGLTTQDYKLVLDLLSAEAREFLSDAEGAYLKQAGERSMLDGTYVGHIHHIPKKGTVKRRAIAPPNRFVQLGTVPADLQLEGILRKLGNARDCTFNQTRLNTYIQNRVNNDNLYAGSVDLHQATDFLPFEWMKAIWQILFSGRVDAMVEQSWELFCHASAGAWLNEGYRDSWQTGQPLGALPSFKCLAITHNLLVEALCFTKGILHSPYSILGDDIVIMNRKVRRAYIQFMERAGVPLSLNKSYESRLVEFAGQMFIKNMAPFYNTDQRAITWNSLFDYQWATGVRIPFGSLPRKLRKRVTRCAVESGLSRDKVELAYELSLYYGMPARGSHVLATGSDQIQDFLPAMACELEGALEPAKAVNHVSGITLLRGGHPVTFADRAYAEKDGYFLEYRRMEPEWFRSKYRPVASDKVIAAAARAVMQTCDAATKT